MTPTQFIQDVYAAFGRGDLPYILAACAEDVDWRALAPTGAPYCGHFKGRDGAKRFFEAFLSTMKLTKFEPRQFLESGETVVVLGREGGTVLPTGRTTEYDWVHVFVVKAGKVAAFTEFSDAATLDAAFKKA